MAVSAVLMSVVLLLHFWKGISIDRLTCDPTAVVKAPSYTGFLSQVGILFWSASAAICMFSAKVLSRHPDNLETKSFLFVSGLLTLVLCLDDVFLLHEQFLLSFFGIPEKVVFIGYAGFMLLYLVRFYSIILNTEYILLGMALVFFAVSIVLDFFDPPIYLFEDGAKLVGIVSWLSYFFRVGTFAVCRNTVRQST